MTTTPGLDWLRVGETVAYITGGRGRANDHAYPAHVDKIGKRDVFVTTSGRTEKFNINHTTESNSESAWLYRHGGTWEPSTYLAPGDDPAVIEIGKRQKRERIVARVLGTAEEFGESPDRASALRLRDTIDAYLDLVESDPPAPRNS